MNVVDSCGWLEFLAEGPNAGFFAEVISDTATLIVPTVCIYEVFKVMLRERGEQDAIMAIAGMQQGNVRELTLHLAMEAARVSSLTHLPMADSMVVATARSAGATIWTQDAHFFGMDGVRYVQAGR